MSGAIVRLTIAAIAELEAILNIGTLVIRIGFGAMLYYSCNTEPQNPILIIKAPTVPQQQINPSCKDWVRNLDPASVFGVPREPKKHLSSARLSLPPIFYRPVLIPIPPIYSMGPKPPKTDTTPARWKQNMVAIPSAVPWKCSVLSPGYLRF